MLQYRRAGLTGVLSTGFHEESARADRSQEPGGALSCLGIGDTRQMPDVIGIAGVARSLTTSALDGEVRKAFALLAATGARVIQYKACSTVDSSPERGSLGRVCELAIEQFGPQPIAAVFAQPAFGRFTFFGHHFAAENGQVFRLDRQPTMSSHPVTPMAESELAVHLGAQTDLAISTLSWPILDSAASTGDPSQVNRAISDDEAGIVICDAFTEEHLEIIGRSIIAGVRSTDPRFVLGAGGISFGIGRAMEGEASSLPGSAGTADGPCLVLSGSRSPQTWAQIEAAVAQGWRCFDLRSRHAIAEAVAQHTAGHNTILQTTDPEGPNIVETEIVEGLATAGRMCLERRPKTRVILCGGDTCGAILRSLRIGMLKLTAAPWGNVVLCEGEGPRGRVEVVLKGGQMGHTGLFEDIKHGGGLNEAW